MGKAVMFLLGCAYDKHLNKIVSKFSDNGKLVLIPDWTGHRPYFLTSDAFVGGFPKDKWGRPMVLKIETVEKEDLLAGGMVNLRKVILANPGVTHDVARFGGLNNVWEDNIKYQWCYMHDLGIVPCIDYTPGDNRGYDPNMTEVSDDRWVNLLGQPIPDIPMVAVDIEIDGRGKMPSFKEPIHPIISIAFWTKEGGTVYTTRDKEDLDPNLKVLVFWYRDELDMIDAAIVEMGKYPIVLSFNGAPFDFMYMHERAMKLGMLYEDTGFVKHWNKGITMDGSESHIDPNKEIIWAGFKRQVHLDLFLLARNTTVQNYIFNAKYKYANLDDVAKAIIGEGKIPTNNVPPGQLSTPDLIKYNLKDAELVYRIMSNNNWAFFRVLVTLARVCKISLEDLCTWRTNKWVQCMLTWEHRKRNILIPNRNQLKYVQAQTTAIIKGKQYEGAKVIDPVRGLWFNVLVLDAASMYPTFIVRKNLSYETIGCKHEECKSNTIPYTSYWVCTKKKGIISTCIGEIRDLRVNKIKALAKSDPYWEGVSQGVKTIMNATYGVFGFKNFSLFWLPMAECITACGRYVITSLEDKMLGFGGKTVGGDTDSIFIVPSPEYIGTNHIIDWAKKELDVDLEMDKTYKWLLLPSLKKNYMGLPVGKDKLVVKGMQSKKVHVPAWVAGVFEKIKAHLIENIDKAKPIPVEGLKGIITEGFLAYVEGKVPIEALTFKMSAKATVYKTEVVDPETGKSRTLKLPQHIRALKETGEEVKEGDVAVFVKTLDGPKLVPNIGSSTMDTKAYLSIYESSMEQVLEPLGLKFADMASIPRVVEFRPKVDIRRRRKVNGKKHDSEDVVPNVLTDILKSQGSA